MKPFWVHDHTDASNFRLRDSINKVEDLIEYAYEIGSSGICITDHESLSNHVKAFQYTEKNKERFKDFKIGYGNEIYLVDRKEIEGKKDIQDKISFHHFILVAKNQRGYRAIKELSSQAWSNSFFYRGMERVPTYKDELESIMKKYKGDIIASTACLGGELPSLILNEDKIKTDEFIVWAKDLFGDDFYLELQPSLGDEQIFVNRILLQMSERHNVKSIVTTDAHYLKKNLAKAHEIYLNAAQGDREVSLFYATTYLMTNEELLEFFEEEVLTPLIENTNEIQKKIEWFDFAQEVLVPKAIIPEYKMNDYFEKFYDEYEYIKKYSESPYDVDRYYLHLIMNGMQEKKELPKRKNMRRIDTELKELYLTSEKMNQPLSSYFVLTKDIVDLMWQVSLVGVSRGSASCYYVNYLLDIVQINPIKYKLPHWRFLTAERPELPDIDLDSESAQRHKIIELVKEKYGDSNVLNMGTLTTEGPRSTVLTASRGLGIDIDVAQNIANMIPTEKGGIWTLKECFFGNEKKGKKPCAEFIQEVSQYEDLKDTMLAIEGLICGRGQHPSGVIIFQNGYLEQNAMMKTTSGLPATQFEAPDSVFMGGLKYDFLSITSLDRIRVALELLLEYKKIEWQGTLRATYEKYFHPDVLEFEAPEMFDMLFEGHVLNAFQFETNVGVQALRKINARSFSHLCSANSLMRLSCQGEQPIDKFTKFKENIGLWFEEMDIFGLDEEEQEIMKNHLLYTNGVCDTQESLMLLSMEPKISGFNLTQANKFRKAVAKQNQQLIEEQKRLFYQKGRELGNREVMLNYVWDKQLAPQFGYAFSLPHIAGYTLILMIQMNICYQSGPVFWKTACLSVNSGLFGESTGNTNYGAIAKAVSGMKGIIRNPDINLSKLGFAPLEETNEIVFGFKPISGLGLTETNIIEENRPYTSFEDFYTRIVKTELLPMNKVVILIKAGCFDGFDGCQDRRLLMTNFVREAILKKTKLTMTQAPHVIPFADQTKLKAEIEVYQFRNKLFGRNKVKMNTEIEKEFIQKYSKDVSYTFENGILTVDAKSFDKEYLRRTTALREWIVSEEAAKRFNIMKMQEFWKNQCMGTVEAWEMETVLFYSKKHELDNMPKLNSYFKIENFNELPEDPAPKFRMYGKRKIRSYEIVTIAGTVVDKVKGKGIVYLATQYGVVLVKYPKGVFSYYDKKIVDVSGEKKEVLDKTWFERGTNLVVTGYRRGEEFVANKSGSSYQHTTFKINGYDKEKIYFQTTKKE